MIVEQLTMFKTLRNIHKRLKCDKIYRKLGSKCAIHQGMMSKKQM